MTRDAHSCPGRQESIEVVIEQLGPGTKALRIIRACFACRCWFPLGDVTPDDVRAIEDFLALKYPKHWSRWDPADAVP